MCEQPISDGQHWNVALIGHSYIRHLQSHMDGFPADANLRLNRSLYTVTTCSRGGLKVRTLANDVSMTQFSTQQDFVFLQIGGNDLCDPRLKNSCHQITSFAQYLRHGVGVRRVIIGQLLRRQPWATDSDYNARVFRLNNLFSAWTKENQDLSIYFWHHRGFSDAALSYLDPRDGVHLFYSSTNRIS
ncbi:LOW QUALITY PROTEIN: hypothetical protein KUTeg_011733 [Tegillarca granosa]|uniref:SGNH hydrolase-type esterase domain-containing protein n=1 Tax=Tegillarca granosa TaxID=220873 RepID=A0ABQ9F2T0_TEGGR|nr:LOW QUALITY PROTEIN: hypothetical protein KUTeg_011733 [Tegillarca granosa]